MKTRIVFGLLAAVLLILLIYYGPFWLMTSVVLVCAGIAYLEFDRLFFLKNSPIRQVGMVALISMNITALKENQVFGWGAFWAAFLILCLVHVRNSNRTGDFQKEARDLSFELLGMVYTLSLFAFIMPIAESTHGRHYLLLLFLLVFMGDTAAYFVGRQLGKRPLAKQLSPKKTVEGALAALAMTVLIAFFWLRFILNEPVSPLWWKILVFTPLASALAQAGDLFESLFKRSQSQKDSGHFIPGHGGILDRIDGLALVSPVYYVYLKLFLHPS